MLEKLFRKLAGNAIGVVGGVTTPPPLPGAAMIEQRPKYQCKNRVLQYINEMENLSVNGSKDNQYNDIIKFEEYFENGAKQAILLSEHHYGHDTENKYVYITNHGVFTNIGDFATYLRNILPNDKNISVIQLGGNHLDITVWNAKDFITPDKNLYYKATYLKIDQHFNKSHLEGEKWHIV